MATRPYIQKTIIELQAIFDVNKDNSVELKKLESELAHRKVPKAVALAKKVSDALKSVKGEEPKKQSEERFKNEPGQPTAQKPLDDPIIKCEGCGQKLRIKIDPETQEFNCPSCKAKFHASFSAGVLSVVFVKSNGIKKDEDQVTLTLKDAYKLFEADETSPWEQIELTRRRLIQQYHPDKVAALGPKLREVADKEGKRINLAFALLRQVRGI